MVRALSHNVPVDVIFLDYAKRFDTVPHIRLGIQIETFGISENLLAWIKAFLTGRRQRVMVNLLYDAHNSCTTSLQEDLDRYRTGQ